MKKFLILTVILLIFSCKERNRERQQKQIFENQECAIEKKVEDCFIKIFEEPTEVYPLLSYMDSISLNYIQYKSNVPVHFSNITIGDNRFSLSEIKENDKSKRLIFNFSKINCNLAEFHLTAMEDDYGRSINGEIEISKKLITVRITGGADIN